MTWIQLVKVIITYFPQLVELLKSLANKTDDLIEREITRKRIVAITRAFLNPNRAMAARELNDAFRT